MRGYWWSPDGDALLVARVDDDAGAALAHRRPGAPRAAAHRGRLPGRRHPQRAGRPADRHAGRHPDPGALGRRARRVPGHGGVGRPRAAHRGAAAGPAGAAGAAGGPGVPGPPRRGTSRPTRPGWTSCPGCRRTPPPARWSPRPTPTARAGWSSTGSPSPRRELQVRAVLDVDGDTVLLSGEHRPVLDRAVLVDRGGRARRAHPRARRARRPAGRRHAGRRPPGPGHRRHHHDRAPAPRRRADHRLARRGARPRPADHPARGGRAASCARRCCCRPGTARAPGCRC